MTGQGICDPDAWLHKPSGALKENSYLDIYIIDSMHVARSLNENQYYIGIGWLSLLLGHLPAVASSCKYLIHTLHAN